MSRSFEELVDDALEQMVNKIVRARQEAAVGLVLSTLSDSGQKAVLAELRSKATETIRAHLRNEAEMLLKRATLIEMLRQRRADVEFKQARPGWGSW